MLDELNEGEVLREHEGVDHDVGALAAGDFFEGFGDDEGVEAEGVFVDAAVGEGEGGGLAVGDHDDLLHVLILFGEDALGEAEAFAGVGVVGADLDAGELGDGDLFGGVVEEDEVEGVARELGADEVGEGHGDAFGGGEAVFAVEDHGVGAVEEYDGGAGGGVVGLVDVDVGLVDVERGVFFAFDGGGEAFAGEDAGEGGGDVEVEGVAELVEFGGAVGLDSGGFVAGVVSSEVGFSEGAEEFAEGFVAEEVHAFVGDFEAGAFCFATGLSLTLLGEFGVDEVLFLHLLDDLVDEFFDLFFGEGFVFFLGFFVEEFSGFEGLADGLAEVVHGLIAVELLKAGEGIVEAGVEEEVGQGLHEIFKAEGGGEVAGEFGVADALHGCSLRSRLDALRDLWMQGVAEGENWRGCALRDEVVFELLDCGRRVLIASGSAHGLEVTEVGSHGFAHGGVFHVGDVAFEADLADDAADLGVVDVGNLGEEVVLDLEVETAYEPGDESALGGEVGGGGDLVDGELVRQFVVAGVREGEIGVFDGVGELEDDGEGDPCGGHGDGEADERVGYSNAGDRDDDEEEGVEDFSGPEFEVLCEAHLRHGNGADPAGEVSLVVDLVDPDDVDHHVEEPAVEVLEAVHPQFALVYVDAHEVADVDVVIDAFDVGEGVVEDAVLDLPDVGAATEAL